MKLTKAERDKLKQTKREIEDKTWAGWGKPTPKKKSSKRKTKSKKPFISITVNTVKAKSQRRKKIKMPAKSIKIFPKTKPQNTGLYRFLTGDK